MISTKANDVNAHFDEDFGYHYTEKLIYQNEWFDLANRVISIMLDGIDPEDIIQIEPLLLRNSFKDFVENSGDSSYSNYSEERKIGDKKVNADKAGTLSWNDQGRKKTYAYNFKRKQQSKKDALHKQTVDYYKSVQRVPSRITGMIRHDKNRWKLDRNDSSSGQGRRSITGQWGIEPKPLPRTVDENTKKYVNQNTASLMLGLPLAAPYLDSRLKRRSHAVESQSESDQNSQHFRKNQTIPEKTVSVVERKSMLKDANWRGAKGGCVADFGKAHTHPYYTGPEVQNMFLNRSGLQLGANDFVKNAGLSDGVRNEIRTSIDSKKEDAFDVLSNAMLGKKSTSQTTSVHSGSSRNMRGNSRELDEYSTPSEEVLLAAGDGMDMHDFEDFPPLRISHSDGEM